MQANPRNLDQLFSSQLRYVVPMFQRLYVWQRKPQWETLWEDIAEKVSLRLSGVSTTPHYLGALIIEGVTPLTPREVKRFLVIDGQQRVTTLQLMLCAFRDVARALKWEALARSVNRLVENPDADVMEHPEEEIYKLWPTTFNRSVFKDIVKSGTKEEVERRHPLVRLPRKRKPEPRSNLVEAYLYFDEAIREFVDATSVASGKSSEDVAYLLLLSLKQDFCVVEIVLTEDDDSQEIFYSLNSQGRPLSQSDLLRSLIFMRAEKQKVDRDEIFDKYWKRFETAFWSGEIKRGGRTYSRLDLGLRYFLMSKTGKMVDARRVNEEYRHWITTGIAQYDSIQAELSDFIAHSEVYERYESAAGQLFPSSDLRRMLIDFDVSTALPLVIHLELAGLERGQLDECLSMLESFLARRTFIGAENKEYNIFFVDVIRSLLAVPAAEIPAALRAKLLSGRGGTRHWPTDAEVVDGALRRQVGSALRPPALRVFLERLEISMRNKKTEDLNVQPALQIEHVLPVSWGAHWPLQGREVPTGIARHHFLAQGEWAEFAEPIRLRNAALQTLGNLTLVNKYLNPAASNGSFEMKLVEYKHSVLRLNRHFDTLKDWNEDEIASRAKALGAKLCAIWPRPEQ